MTKCDLTMEEMSLSLTGFDEIAIKQAFNGLDPYVDVERDPMSVQRALVFVHLRREGAKDHDAKTAAMEMTAGAVAEYFADDQDEITPDEPETESGKDS